MDEDSRAEGLTPRPQKPHWSHPNKMCHSRGWGDGLISEVLVTCAWGLKSGNPALQTHAKSCLGCFNESECRGGRDKSVFQAHLPESVAKSVVSSSHQRPHHKQWRRKELRATANFKLWLPYTSKHTCTCTNATHTYRERGKESVSKTQNLGTPWRWYGLWKGKKEWERKEDNKTREQNLYVWLMTLNETE